MCWQDIRVIWSSVNTYRHWWPSDVSFKSMNSEPDLTPSRIKRTRTCLHCYETQETCEMAWGARIEVNVGTHNWESSDPGPLVTASGTLSGEGWPHTGCNSPLPPAPAEPSAHAERDVAVQGLALHKHIGQEQLSPQGLSSMERTHIHPKVHRAPSKCSNAQSTVQQPTALGLCSHHQNSLSPHYY